MMAFYFYFY